MLITMGMVLSSAPARAGRKEPAFLPGKLITYQEFRRDYKKGSVLVPGEYYTLYACIDGTVQLPFYKGILSPGYYYGSACYDPEQLYITHDDALGLQREYEFRHTKGMFWVTVSVNVDGGISIIDFKR